MKSWYLSQVKRRTVASERTWERILQTISPFLLFLPHLKLIILYSYNYFFYIPILSPYLIFIYFACLFYIFISSAFFIFLSHLLILYSYCVLLFYTISFPYFTSNKRLFISYSCLVTVFYIPVTLWVQRETGESCLRKKAFCWSKFKMTQLSFPQIHTDIYI